MNNYERLTDKKDLNKPTCFNCEYNYSNCITCERRCVDGNCFELREELQRLVQLEDKIENGTLVELPCKVNDTVYMIWIDRLDENNAPIHKIQSGRIFAIQLENKEGNLDIWLRVDFGLTYCCRRIGDFYLTKSEAEAELKKLNRQ